MRWSLGTLAILAATLGIAGIAAACQGLSPGDAILNVEEESGCTLAFLLANRDGLYFATAGHCGRVNQTAAHRTTIDAQGRGTIGPFVFHHLEPQPTSEADRSAGRPGDDFGLIAIDPALWKDLNPKVCGYAGPTGIYDASPGEGIVRHYGHGTALGELPHTRAREGPLVFNDNVSFHWVGSGVPGDSGSAVLHEDGRAMGVLTHLQVGVTTNGGTHLLRGLQLAHAAGFAPLRLVLMGEDPVAIHNAMRAPPEAEPLPPTPTNAPTPTPTAGSPPPTRPTPEPEPQTRPTPEPQPESVTPEPLAPAGTREESGTETRTPARVPGPAAALVALVIALVAWRRR